MKKSSLLLLFLFILPLFCGAASPQKKVQKLVPPPIISKWQTERPKVVETGAFTSIEVPPVKSRNKTPSAADKVTESGKSFSWKPSPLLSSTIRIADLTGAALSEDGTLAVISERIGGEGKANSTRFILVDIPNCRIAGGFVIPEMLISKIAFVPGSHSEVLGIRSGFAPFKVKEGIVKIDLKEKNIADAFDSPAGKIISFAADNKGKLFFTAEGEKSFFEGETDSFAVEALQVKSRITAPRVCAADGMCIVYGKEGVEVFRKDGKRWIPDEEVIKAPSETFAPVNCQVIDPAIFGVCFSGKNGNDAWYLQGKNFRKLKERISGIVAWDGKEKLLFVEIASNSRVCVFNMPEAAENVKPATPNRLRPANRNGTFALLHVPVFKQKMLHIDNRGNLFLLDYSRLIRWKKSTVYIADKTAFR